MPQEQYAYHYYDHTRQEQHQTERDGESRVTIQADAAPEEANARRELVGAGGEVGEGGEALSGGDALLEVLHNAHCVFTACGEAARWRWACAERRGACAGVAIGERPRERERETGRDGGSRSANVVGS